MNAMYMTAAYGYDYAGTTSSAGNLNSLAVLFSGAYLIIMLIFMAILIVANWKIFTKAGEPGWACFVPFYSQYLLFKIAWGNGWLFLLMCIPVANAIVSLIVLYKLSVAFGHGIGFFLGLLFLSPIFILILGFGSSQYQGPA